MHPNSEFIIVLFDIYCTPYVKHSLGKFNHIMVRKNPFLFGVRAGFKSIC